MLNHNKRNKGFFITGTNTAVGKTTITAALSIALRKRNLDTLALKPVASGGIDTVYGLRNSDALILQQESSIKIDYSLINPYLFPLATSPNIAANKVGATVTAQDVYNACEPAFSVQADVVLVEGAGGWCCPLNNVETFADMAHLFSLPVILVVGVCLGSLNHAVLTCKAIQADGAHLVGWVANMIDPEMLCADEYITSLQNFIAAPLLGRVPYLKKISYDAIAEHIDLCFMLE